jgi:hypothetical protein
MDLYILHIYVYCNIAKGSINLLLISYSPFNSLVMEVLGENVLCSGINPIIPYKIPNASLIPVRSLGSIWLKNV